jgi:hypothetical protein
MKMKNFFALSITGLMISPSLAVADNFGDISGKVGTLGLGIEYSRLINEHFAARAGINGFSYDLTLEESGVEYDADVKLKNASAIADYFPWKSGFHISGGILFNGNEASLTGQLSDGTFEFNGVTYNDAAVGSVTGDVDFNNIAPYLGFGWKRFPTANSRLSFNVDIGVMYQGEPETSLHVVCGGALSATQCAQLQSDVAAEKEQLDDEISDFKWYPVISMTIGYQF